jgi:SAM-dependent methyltransferase
MPNRVVQKLDSVWCRYRFVPWVRNFFYELVTLGTMRRREWKFMNLGYDLPAHAAPLILRDPEQADRYHIQLYHTVIGKVDLSGKNILETGCGRGGGAEYLARSTGAASVTATDRSPMMIRFCRANAKDPNLEFRVADTLALPFPENTFEAVFNIEAAPNAPQWSRFFNETARVLKPGGTFHYCEKFSGDAWTETRNLINSTGLEVTEEEDLSAGMLRALEATEQQRRAAFEAYTPPFFRRFVFDWVALPGGNFYTQLASGNVRLIRCVARKR